MAKKPNSNIDSAPKGNSATESSLEKYLAFAFVGSVIVSVVAILVILLAPLVSNTWVPSGWGMIPILVMPFGVVCLIALLVASAINRKRHSQNT
jgi:CDP-diglyceride synthetase